jgi:PAS domain S-box-containing protein
MLGYENGELIGKSMYETISDDYGQKELRDYLQILIQQQPKPESWFSKMVKKDGDTLDVQIDWNYKRNRQGEIIGFISIITDITERKQVEEALQESEKKFQVVADFTYDWEYWVAPDGRHIYVSPSCRRITGYAPDDFKNNPELMMEIIHPDDRAMVTKHHHRVDKSDRLWPIDFRIITKDGNERWIGHICQAVFDTDGRFLGRRGSNRDITQQKKLHEELLK